jgi:hypothetical protein
LGAGLEVVIPILRYQFPVVSWQFSVKADEAWGDPVCAGSFEL